jgi:hypothetical protein
VIEDRVFAIAQGQADVAKKLHDTADGLLVHKADDDGATAASLHTVSACRRHRRGCSSVVENKVVEKKRGDRGEKGDREPDPRYQRGPSVRIHCTPSLFTGLP